VALDYFYFSLFDFYLGLEGVKIVPFHTIAQLYGLYCLDCSDDNRPKEEVASAETFRQAFREMEESKLVKLISCKGAFCTCLVCNVLDEMLMNSSKFVVCLSHYSTPSTDSCVICCSDKRSRSREDREAMLNFKAMHLAQQAAERDAMKAKRARAKNEYASGQPMFLWLLTGMMLLYHLLYFRN